MHAFRRFPFLDLGIEVAGKKLERKTAFLFVGNNEYEITGLRIGGRRRLDTAKARTLSDASHRTMGFDPSCLARIARAFESGEGFRGVSFRGSFYRCASQSCLGCGGRRSEADGIATALSLAARCVARHCSAKSNRLMRTLIHLSDLHFGRVDPRIVPPLLDLIRTTKPDLVAISGDLTQRARTAEFQAARKFLQAIPFPQIVVPGNHDVPLYNLLARFTRKLDRYRRYITTNLEPFYANSEIAVAGVNTARALAGKNGRINRGQLEKLRARFSSVPPTHVKIVVTHHPFDLPEGVTGDHVVGRAKLAMKTLAECRVDMLLAGHFHIGSTGYTATRYRIENYSALIVSSGTSTSTRGRGQANSLNVIRIDGAKIAIARYTWRPEQGAFDLFSTEKFSRTENG